MNLIIKKYLSLLLLLHSSYTLSMEQPIQISVTQKEHQEAPDLLYGQDATFMRKYYTFKKDPYDKKNPGLSYTITDDSSYKGYLHRKLHFPSLTDQTYHLALQRHNAITTLLSIKTTKYQLLLLSIKTTRYQSFLNFFTAIYKFFVKKITGSCTKSQSSISETITQTNHTIEDIERQLVEIDIKEVRAYLEKKAKKTSKKE